MELKVSYRFIDNFQPTNSNVNLLQCYGIFLTSLNHTCTKVKNTPNPAMIQHIRDCSRKSSTLQVRDGTGTLAKLLLIVVYFPFPHK